MRCTVEPGAQRMKRTGTDVFPAWPATIASILEGSSELSQIRISRGNRVCPSSNGNDNATASGRLRVAMTTS